MSDLETRLVRCFTAIFPEESPDQLKNATMENTEKWDSVAGVTLINVVEEEFGLQIDVEDFTRLVSFSRFADYLRRSSIS
jgi:acyl carrier protein